MSPENLATITISLVSTVIIPYLIIRKDRKQVDQSNQIAFQNQLMQEINTLRSESSQDRAHQQKLIQEYYKSTEECEKNRIELLEKHRSIIEEYQNKNIDLYEQITDLKIQIQNLHRG